MYWLLNYAWFYKGGKCACFVLINKYFFEANQPYGQSTVNLGPTHKFSDHTLESYLIGTIVSLTFGRRGRKNLLFAFKLVQIRHQFSWRNEILVSFFLYLSSTLSFFLTLSNLSHSLLFLSHSLGFLSHSLFFLSHSLFFYLSFYFYISLSPLCNYLSIYFSTVVSLSFSITCLLCRT